MYNKVYSASRNSIACVWSSIERYFNRGNIASTSDCVFSSGIIDLFDFWTRTIAQDGKAVRYCEAKGK